MSLLAVGKSKLFSRTRRNDVNIARQTVKIYTNAAGSGEHNEHVSTRSGHLTVNSQMAVFLHKAGRLRHFLEVHRVGSGPHTTLLGLLSRASVSLKLDKYFILEDDINYFGHLIKPGRVVNRLGWPMPFEDYNTLRTWPYLSLFLALERISMVCTEHSMRRQPAERQARKVPASFIPDDWTKLKSERSKQ